jgi:hypothetical protein
MHAPPEVLKTQLALNDAQLAKVQAIRNNFLNKRITYRAQIQKLRLQQRQLMESSNLPSEAKVLQLMRKKRAIRGKLAEERVKAWMRSLKLLSKEQLALVKARCPGPGWGWGWKGRGRGWGRGPGWHRGGPGWGRGGGPGWRRGGGPGWRRGGGGPGWGGGPN